MRQYGAAELDGDLLTDLDARVTRLPRLFTLTDGLEEGKQCGYAKRRRHHGERAGGRVTHVLVHVVYVWSHRRNHGRQTGGLK